MTPAEFDRIVDEALEELPEWVVERIDNLMVETAARPSVAQDPSGEGLLGLYEGVSLLERGIDYFGTMPDTITVFREPHLALGLSPRRAAVGDPKNRPPRDRPPSRDR